MKNTLLSCIAVLALSHLAYAGGDIATPEEAVPVVEDSQWEFRLSPYAWFAGFKGDVASVPSLGDSIYVDISSSDALSDTEASLAFVFEGKKGKHGFLTDFLYSDMRSNTALVDGVPVTLDSVSKTTLFSAAYMYELYNNESAVIDVYGGARYWKIDTDLSLSVITPSIGHVESWIDPLIGIKGRTALGDTKFYVTASATVGGFGVGSDLFYDLAAHLGYQWSKSIGTTIGYRMYDLDYENDGFVYDVKQEGWMLGLTWAF